MGKTAIWTIFSSPFPHVNNVGEQRPKVASSNANDLQHFIGREGEFCFKKMNKFLVE